MKYNLLTEPLFTCQDGKAWTLPGLLAQGARGAMPTLVRHRAHHRAAWHMFMVQLATLALSASGKAVIPEDEAGWRDLLRKLTPDFANDAAWHLIADNDATPAFLQAPDPQKLAKTVVQTPDGLDLLITAKNFDIKMDMMRSARPEDWAFALIMRQTMGAYNGSGNYGIARMNGGSSSRLCCSAVPLMANGTLSLEGWFRTDLDKAINIRSTKNDIGPTKIGGHALLWTLPWPEGKQIPMHEIDPMGIEISRRIRLSEHDGTIVALSGTSKASRADAKIYNGDVGDLWSTLIQDKQGTKSITLNEGQFNYKRIAGMLFDSDHIVAPMQTNLPKGNFALYFGGLAAGNCKTHGYQERIVVVPEKARRKLFDPSSKKILEELLEETNMATRAFDSGLMRFISGLPPEENTDPSRRSAFRQAFSNETESLDRDIDKIFFDHLFERIAAEGVDGKGHARDRFAAALGVLATSRFEQALLRLTVPLTVRLKSEHFARKQFNKNIHALCSSKMPNKAMIE